jgi:alkylated DNA repair dioxygenase AlkB
MLTISGLTYVPQFITPPAEQTLLQTLDAQEWSTEISRRVQQYGYRYDYRQRTVDLTMYLGALPPWGQLLAAQFVAAGYCTELPDQIIVNEYTAGQGIRPHVDCEPCFGNAILSLSLGAACGMDFIRLSDQHRETLWLERGSLLVMQGVARYDWQHGIAPRKTDVVNGQTVPRGRRVSLTFRKVQLTS